uniref:Histone acetyl transferase HAT1 N-terminal domain-containing protein n=1 Tax=Oncorhynchus tshawytscha TaxID=74940 RepID=A0AAZ3SVZ6_ONCTS
MGALLTSTTTGSLSTLPPKSLVRNEIAMPQGMNEMEKKLAEYKCDTNEAICLKLVRFAEEVDNESTTFHPEYSHQLYGDDMMMSKGRSGRSFPLGSAATRTTSSHCWRKRPTSNPSVPCFTHTTSTMWRREKTLPTRFTRWTCRALESETTMSACRPSSCGS